MIFEFYSCFIVKNMNDLFSIVKKINITKNELLQCINNNIDTLNHKNNNGKTFFMIFIINIIKCKYNKNFYSSFYEIVEYIFKLYIKYDYDINIQDNSGKTLLMYTFQKLEHNFNLDHFIIELIKILIQTKKNLNIQDNYGKTALMYSPYIQKILFLVEKLIENNYNLNIKDNIGKTALFYYIDNLYTLTDSFKLLIKYDNQCMFNEYTSLMYYCSNIKYKKFY